ncbi:hypothetical protein RND81_08G107000 [Saponaria officinalis]|uniref:SMP-30/Gluconolactonase/LRE-like region domain-containing protein n=1 Tax=Saponaria officinalis TaxID=3572 RepID=A0AAW1J691_SAPOF
MTKSLLFSLSLFILIFITLSPISESRDPHIINFRSPGLYPEGLAWDPVSQHFIVAAIRRGTFHSVSDAGVAETLTLALTSSEINLPPNPVVLGLAVDSRRNRLIATVNTVKSPYLAAFSLQRTSISLLYLSRLPTTSPSTAVAKSVAIDPHGNAYVTNSGENFIWKVTENGTASILSKSSKFTRHPVDLTSPYSYWGLNGIAYVTGKEYLLVLQSNTNKMFKVDAVDGKSTSVAIPAELTEAGGIAVREDGVVVVITKGEAWMMKSDDSWGRGGVIDRIALDREGYASSVTVGGGGRVYVLYGYVEEGIKGIWREEEREWFRIEEVRSKKESDGESVWPFVMIGLGLVYFLFWRFQMGRLVKNLDKKHG